ncbi:MAG: aldehyde dehydrogenase family protein [Polyangiaceae bacterium]
MADIVSPIDGNVAFTFEELSFEAALALLDRAERAQRAFASTTIAERVALLDRVLDAYRARLDENARAITRMMGKPVGHARAEFERPMTARVKHLSSIAEAALAPDAYTDQPGFERRIERVPVGVVLVIAAWNYPLLVPINALAAAVLSGNAVLVKHAPQTALVAEQLERAFADAGAPAGLVQALPVDHAVAKRLIDTRRFGFVSFTGSVRGGHEVYRAVADQNFIGVGLELGGKDPAIVLSDCDFDDTVENLVDGAFFNAGQSCCAIERIYVEASIHDRFLEAFAAATRQYVLGDPLDGKTNLGPVVNARSAAFIRGQIADAIDKGARAVVGGADFEVPTASECYVAPHVLEGVDHTMSIMTEETFGPAIGIAKVASVEEAVRLANDSRYGLTASVWTKDLDRARAIGQSLQAGTVFANRCDYLDPALAWTGVKDSGTGVSLSKLGFLAVTRPKNYHLRSR